MKYHSKLHNIVILTTQIYEIIVTQNAIHNNIKQKLFLKIMHVFHNGTKNQICTSTKIKKLKLIFSMNPQNDDSEK